MKSEGLEPRWAGSMSKLICRKGSIADRDLTPGMSDSSYIIDHIQYIFFGLDHLKYVSLSVNKFN